MGLLTWIILGLVAGLLAKWVLPGKDDGIVITIIIGIVGALLGGFISSRLGFGTVDGFNIISVIIAFVGAILALFIYRKLIRKR